jgi:pyruvate ferredoxin oxidoreductase delta subunit
MNTPILPTAEFNTNEDWRFEEPQWDHDKCIRCGVCFLFCPDGAIHRTPDGYYEVDQTYCKGCGICIRQCTTGCITAKPVCDRPPWMKK